jgi:hypothetical protein
MTAEEVISGATSTVDQIIPVGDKKITVVAGGKLTAKIPVFPYTGTAIITNYDANGKVTEYYAAATINKGDNTNIIDTDGACYAIAVDETRDKVGEILEQDGQNVWVDSKQSGRTTLEGTVTVGGELVSLDAETNTVYTSVQWNPIENSTESTTSDGFTALKGQRIEVVAQLTDQNGNAVKTTGEKVYFYQNNTEIDYDKSKTLTGVALAGGSNVVSIISQDKVTNASGQAVLSLKASDAVALINISAKSETASKYNVVLTIAGKEVSQADLYWIDADLSFTDSAYDSKSYSTAGRTNGSVEVTEGISPIVGETWEYAVETVGSKIGASKTTYGVLAGETIEINNLGIGMTARNDSVGKVETNTGVNGMVTAYSEKTGKAYIVAKIDSSSLTSNVTTSVGTFAGQGTPSIDKKMTLDVNWKNNGMSASIVTPLGTRIVDKNDVIVYVKVADSYGNPVKGETVTFAVDKGATLSNVKTSVVTSTATTSEKYGVAAIKLTKDGSSTTSTVTATVGSISNDKFVATYTWLTNQDLVDANVTDLKIKDTENANTGKFDTVFDKASKTVTLVFNNDIVESSVVPEEFTVEYTENVKATPNPEYKKYAVSAASVKDNTITLTLAEVPSTVTADGAIRVTVGADAEAKDVKYTVTSVDGVQLEDNTEIMIYSDVSTAPVQTPTSKYTKLFDVDAVTAEVTGTDLVADTIKVTSPTANGSTVALAITTDILGLINVVAGDTTKLTVDVTKIGTSTFTATVTYADGTNSSKTFSVTSDGAKYSVVAQ